MEAGAEFLRSIDGTWVLAVFGRRRRRPSYEKKKNVLSRKIGPPITPPKLFCLSAGFGKPSRLLNQSLASSASLRKYSKTEPVNRFVPGRVTSETCAPGVRPYSGAYEEVSTRNSCKASMETRLFVPPVAPRPGNAPPVNCP